jgi:hypothetical protein
MNTKSAELKVNEDGSLNLSININDVESFWYFQNALIGAAKSCFLQALEGTSGVDGEPENGGYEILDILQKSLLDESHYKALAAVNTQKLKKAS